MINNDPSFVTYKHRVAPGWETIDTFPEEFKTKHVRVLAFDANSSFPGVFIVAYYEDDDYNPWQIDNKSSGCNEFSPEFHGWLAEPTHWRRLPAPVL